MTIFEIKKNIRTFLEKAEQAVNPETGEIEDIDFKAYDRLRLAQDQKIENTALFLKEIRAKIEGMETEAKNLSERIAKEKRFADRLVNLLQYATEGKEFSSSKCEVKHKTSYSCGVREEFKSWAIENAPQFIRHKVVESDEVNKADLLKALKAGESFEYAELVEKINTTVK